MKRLLILFILQAILSSWLPGQKRTIEIEVSDTISVVPDEWIYMFTINEEEDSFDEYQGKPIGPPQLEEMINVYPEIILIKDDPSILRSDIYESMVSNTLIKSTSKHSINSLVKDLVQTRHIVYTYKGTWFTLYETHKLLKKSKNGLENKKCHGTENTIY